MPYNPVFFAYLVITLDEIILFTDSDKIDSEEVQSHLDAVGVTVRSYDDVWSYLQGDSIKGTVSGQIAHRGHTSQ